jgi:hypothetical protein
VRRERLAVAAALLALAAPAAVARADGPPPRPRPDALQQPLTDGCQRNPAGLLTFTSPEWVYVYRDPTVRVMEGTATGSSPAGEDLPQNHAWYDFDSNVKPDPQYDYLLGGDPNANPPNGNFGGDPGAEDKGKLHVEWESGTFPTYSWFTEGDRVKLWGSWIWDCGHWGPGFTDKDYFLPGQDPLASSNIRGEQTEFHPMHFVEVTRANPNRGVVPETQADTFASTDGTAAYGEAECTLKSTPLPSSAGYGPDWTACIRTTHHQPLDDNYTFFVPAPKKPSRKAKLRYRVVKMVDGKAPEEQVQPTATGIRVTVPFKGFGSASDDLRYGKSFFVGWERDGRQAAHLQIEPLDVKIIHSLDPNSDPTDPATSLPPGEYNLYFDANGTWRLLNDWAPELGRVLDGQMVRFSGQKDDFYVQPGGGVRVFIRSRECDLPTVSPCPDTPEVSSGNDGPGDVTQKFASADAAVGEHVAKTANYEFRYRIIRLPGGPCAFDADTPLSHFRGRSAHISRTRLRVKGLKLRGRTSDRKCKGVKGKVKRVNVAVALRTGKKCRFLQKNHKLGSKAFDCNRQRTYQRAAGTTKWSFRVKGALPKGHYTAFVRATDSVGNTELRNLRRNRIRFRVGF